MTPMEQELVEVIEAILSEAYQVGKHTEAWAWEAIARTKGVSVEVAISQAQGKEQP